MARSIALYAAWTLVGFVGSFALLYGFTPAGPVIGLVVWLASRYLPRISERRLPEASGALAGLGAFLLFVASTVGGDGSRLTLFGAAVIAGSICWYLVAGRRRCAQGLAAT